MVKEAKEGIQRYCGRESVSRFCLAARDVDIPLRIVVYYKVQMELGRSCRNFRHIGWAVFAKGVNPGK